METIPTLWATAYEWMEKQKIGKSPLLNYFIEDNSRYNGCHFWSNFEVARTDLWGSELYLSFFNHLDKSGGFFYERYRLWFLILKKDGVMLLFIRCSSEWHFRRVKYMNLPILDTIILTTYNALKKETWKYFLTNYLLITNKNRQPANVHVLYSDTLVYIPNNFHFWIY